MPAANWGERELEDVLPRVADEAEDPRFELREVRDVEMKGLGSVSVREIHNTGMWLPTTSAEDRAVEGLRVLKDGNRYAGQTVS
jgi:hypothetical protein